MSHEASQTSLFGGSNVSVAYTCNFVLSLYTHETHIDLVFLCLEFLCSKHIFDKFSFVFHSSVLLLHIYHIPMFFSFPLFYIPVFQTDP
jgi:hypothetical protein